MKEREEKYYHICCDPSGEEEALESVYKLSNEIGEPETVDPEHEAVKGGVDCCC
jgi:hypothetical protein